MRFEIEERAAPQSVFGPAAAEGLVGQELDVLIPDTKVKGRARIAAARVYDGGMAMRLTMELVEDAPFTVEITNIIQGAT